MIYAKYEFDEIPEILKPTEENRAAISATTAAVVIIGKLTKVPGTYDEAGNELTAPVISDKIAVDIIYRNEVDPSLEPYRIYPKTPSHTIAGMEDLYLETLT